MPLLRASLLTAVRLRLSASAQSILNDEKGWKPSVTVKQILTGIQELLDSPNNADAAQEPAWRLLQQSVPKYIERVKTEVAKYPAEGGGEPAARGVMSRTVSRARRRRRRRRAPRRGAALSAREE